MAAAPDDMDLDGFPQVLALHDYTGRSERELSFKAGDLLTVTDITDENWWEGAFNGRRGFIAAAYVDHNPARAGGSGGGASAYEPAAPEEAAALPAPLSGGEGSGTEIGVKRKAHMGAAEGRPDIVKALRAHGAKAKHDQKGRNELLAAMARVKTKQAKTQASEMDELGLRLKQRAQQTTDSIDKQKQLDSMSELEKRFQRRESQRFVLDSPSGSRSGSGHTLGAKPGGAADGSGGGGDDDGDSGRGRVDANSELGRKLQHRKSLIF